MRPVVVDASALVEVLLLTPRSEAVGAIVREREADLHVPGLCDIEVISALRKVVLRGLAAGPRAEEAIQDYLDLPLSRHGHEDLLGRCFQLRNVMTVYDAAYVALAEGLGAPLVTTDLRLARTATALGLECLPRSAG